MKGIVLDGFVQFVEQEYGMKILNGILDKKEFEYFLHDKTYPDVLINMLIEELSVSTECEKPRVEEDFGYHFLGTLYQLYPHYFHQSNLKQFLNKLNHYIHPEIELNLPGAVTPQVNLQPTDKGFEFYYESDRKMPYFALGMLKRCNEFYGNNYSINVDIENQGRIARYEFEMRRGI